MTPFDRSYTSSYSHSIVTMAISCIVCEIQRLISKKSEIFMPHLYFAPPCLMLVKQNDCMIELPYGEKNYNDMLSSLHTIPACHGRYGMVQQGLTSPSTHYRSFRRRTDGRTDGRTDRIAISISRVSVLTRDKKWIDIVFGNHHFQNGAQDGCYITSNPSHLTSQGSNLRPRLYYCELIGMCKKISRSSEVTVC